MRAGLDFGTTNSSLAGGSGAALTLTRFATANGGTDSFRSLLYFEQPPKGGRLRAWAGPEAIEQYLEAENKGRLIQSLKSFLTSRGLRSTEIFGQQALIEDLIARIVRPMREEAERQWGCPVTSVMAGRPVHFVGAESEADNDFALERLRVAFTKAGFEEIDFEMEPVAAAYHYAATLDHEELILVGDFGGGTSDFSLLRVGGSRTQLLGNEGVGLAGDALDAKIVRHVVSPALGAGTMLKSFGKTLPVPTWVYAKLERWHHLSMLRSRDTLHMLETTRKQALEGDRIEALLHLIKEDLGYRLHQSVQRAKVDLSKANETIFRYADGIADIETRITRAQFEGWIAEELAAIESCVDRLLANTGVDAKAIDAVFLTGGTSFVPAVQAIFASRFGADRIRSGNEFTSVARGLALRAE
ncbi:MAG: Hsp70 family protein [Bryobacteraceae bacterium]|nr:Hsp70 family protein [Bryobacteraceae bacterium]